MERYLVVIRFGSLLNIDACSYTIQHIILYVDWCDTHRIMDLEEHFSIAAPVVSCFRSPTRAMDRSSLKRKKYTEKKLFAVVKWTEDGKYSVCEVRKTIMQSTLNSSFE